MVISCVAFGCSATQNPFKPISFHRFPFSRPEVLQRWIEAVGRENWQPSKSSRLCGYHFLPTDYYQILDESTHKRLKPDAVPSIFSDR